jgi:hypothetical protein
MTGAMMEEFQDTASTCTGKGDSHFAATSRGGREALSLLGMTSASRATMRPGYEQQDCRTLSSILMSGPGVAYGIRNCGSGHLRASWVGRGGHGA